MKPPISLYTHPFPPQLYYFWLIKIIPNQTIKTLFVCWALFIPATISLGLLFHRLNPTIHINMFLFSSCKMLQLHFILKHQKGGYHLLWLTHNPHMHQPMKDYDQKLSSLLKNCIKPPHANKVGSEKNVPGFVSTWYLWSIDMPYFRIFWPPKVTSTRNKQPAEHNGDGNSICWNYL